MTSDEAYALLKGSFEAGRFGQAYVIVAPPREEGARLAQRLLQFICCEQPKRPCGQCPACVQIEKRTYPDVLWVEPKTKSRKISIEDVRELQGRIFQTSYTGGWKACVLVGADRLQPQAANAFLKTLEEPSPRSVFLLLTDAPQFLLPTVLSRCQIVALAAPESVLPEPWMGHLTAILSAMAAKAAPIARFACAGKLVKTLEALKQEAKEEEAAIAGGEATEEEDDTLEARINARYREKRTRLMRSLLFWYRDILLLACGADDRLVHYQAHIGVIRRLAGRVTRAQALRDVRVAEHMNRQMEMNLPDGTVIGAGLSALT